MIVRRSVILLAILFTACASQTSKVIFYPDPVQDNPQEQAGLNEDWQITETQNGPGDTGIPDWLRLYMNKGVREVESLDAYSGKYVFIGENRGTSLNTLQQWANNFSTAQDLPRLIAHRVEQRFIASASLYPDDEYGEYFENTIKKISDEEYAGANKEQTFWIKRHRIPVETEEDEEFPEPSPLNINPDRYEFFVLINMDKNILQENIRRIMANIKTGTAPQKDQTAAINKLRSSFFEDF